jgi:acyl dehydratase
VISMPQTSGPPTSVSRDVYAEHLSVGLELDLGAHAVTEPEIIEFATAWDPQFFHVDPEAAAHSYFGGIIASGLHSMAILQRLAVAGQFRDWNVIAGKTIHDLRLLAPVRPGDVLTGRLRVDAIEPDGRGRADVTLTGELLNQTGRTVLRMVMESLMLLAPADDDEEGSH